MDRSEAESLLRTAIGDPAGRFREGPRRYGGTAALVPPYTFVDSKPVFEGLRLGLKRHPLTHGKEATFWHMIQEGAIEDERIPDLRRCERIRWPRPIIEHVRAPAVKVWSNQRKGEKRICLWLEHEDYLVILADRGDYILPWTAYLVEQPHRKRKLLKEYEDYQRGRT